LVEIHVLRELEQRYAVDVGANVHDVQFRFGDGIDVGGQAWFARMPHQGETAQAVHAVESMQRFGGEPRGAGVPLTWIVDE